jgi:hypothetical protein
MRNDDTLYYRQKEVFLKNYSNYLKECGDDEKAQTFLLTNLIYSIYSNKPKAMGKSRDRYIKETAEIMHEIEYTIKDNV